jgi:hypothetical protein
LEGQIALSPSTGGSSIPFSHLSNPYTRIILTDVFTQYCRENDIAPNSPDYQDARELVLTLFQNGPRTVPHLKAALVGASRRAR